MNSIQFRISDNIKRFDICSLIRLLYEIGYKRKDIYFESNADNSSRPSLCEEIFFSENDPKVRIVVNLGLLSVNTPLPDFFKKKMDSGSIDPDLFSHYIKFFDHHLINNLLEMSMPDINNIFFSSWQLTKAYYLKLLDLNSTSTLWHLFQVCYPELKVKVVKAPRVIKKNSSSVILGKIRLGENSFLGKKIVQTIPSFKIMLTSDDSYTDMSVLWPIEIMIRFRKLIFSTLQRTHIHFRLIYIQTCSKGSAYLKKSTQLGYCMLGDSNEPLKIILFSGFSKDLI